LEARFGPQFSDVVITDRDKRFLAAVPQRAFLERLDSNLMKVLNAEAVDLPVDEASDRLTAQFDAVATDSVRATWTAARALRDPIWRDVDDNQRIAVTGDDVFLGLTSRERMLDGVLAHS
jgi:hypothetical protein